MKSPPEHGTMKRYANKTLLCRCDLCRKAAADYQLARKIRLKGVEPPKHGTLNGYNSYGCRCHACKEAGSVYARMYKFGLTKQNVIDMMKNAKCAVCQSTKKLHVDHDHTTGAIRGVLCQSCNMALGMAKDDPIILRGLIDYLA